jgi:transcriptional regulator with XRE-family HTH domain
MKELSKKIRLLRHQKNWSQEEIAKRLNISIPAYSKIETGITDINVTRLRELAAIFDMSLVQLLTFKDSEEQMKLNNDMEEMATKLHDREVELLNLQKKIIELYEELRVVKA